MTQKDVAIRAKISLRTYVSLEKAKIFNPKISTIIKVAEALDINATVFLKK